jgi:hypothetical protein
MELPEANFHVFAAGKKWCGTKTRKPPFRPHSMCTVSKYVEKGFFWRFAGNLQDVSTELLRNH